MRIIRGLLFLTSQFLIGLAALAQQGTATLIVPLGVYDSNGQFVEGIKEDGIQVRDPLAKVRSVTLDSTHRRIVLLLDVSGTMGVSPVTKVDNWPPAREMARSFVSSMEEGDEVALYAFAGEAKALVPFTQDQSSILRAIDALPQPGSDARRASFGHSKNVERALSIIQTKEAGTFRIGDAIVLLSDAYDPLETIKLKRAGVSLIACGIRFILMRVGELTPAEVVVYLSPTLPQIASWYESVRPSGEFGRLAEETGGFSVDPWASGGASNGKAAAHPSLETLRASARSTYARVRSIYRIELEMTVPVRHGSKLNLELVNGRDRAKKFVLSYPRHIPAFIPQL